MKNTPNTLQHVSASQVEEFWRCPRRWYEAKILKNPQPSSPAMERGGLIHKEMEHYELTGTFRESDYSLLVQAAADELGEQGLSFPNSLYEIERAIEIPTINDGPKWIGYIDLLDETRAMEDEVHIIDHKTTSDFRYCKTEEELQRNIQLNAYAYWAMKKYALNQVRVSHLYLRTRGKPKVKWVSTVVSAEMICDTWIASMSLVAQMVEWAAKAPAKSDALPPNTASCDLYGGCHYRPLCGLEAKSNNPFGRSKVSEISEKSSALMARLKAKLAAASEAAAPVAVEAAEPPAAQGILPPDAPTRETPAPVPAVVEAATPKRGRGRPKRGEGAVVEVQVGEKISDVVAQMMAPEVNTLGPVVFLDCIPIKGHDRPVQWQEWAQPIMEMVAEANGVKDWRLIKFTSKGDLAIAMRENISTCPKTVLVSSSDPGSEVFLEAVVPHASLFVRALRG